MGEGTLELGRPNGGSIFPYGLSRQDNENGTRRCVPLRVVWRYERCETDSRVSLRHVGLPAGRAAEPDSRVSVLGGTMHWTRRMADSPRFTRRQAVTSRKGRFLAVEADR